MAKIFNDDNLYIGIIKKAQLEDCGADNVSSCVPVLRAAASFGKVPEKDIVNASVAAELFYQALHSHYYHDRGSGKDIIQGDNYGAKAIIFASKVKDPAVISTFCESIQNATKAEDDKYGSAGRLANIYGASAYVGAYMAGLSPNVLPGFRNMGEKVGLKKLGVLELKDWNIALETFDESDKFLDYLGLN